MTAVGWSKCLEQYICGLDTIRTIEIFIEIKKHGSSVLEYFHQTYAKKCTKAVFFHRICMASKYFGAHTE